MAAGALIKTPKTAKTKTQALPLEERIRARAYELYVQRGNASGSEIDDWLQAEQEVSDIQDQRLEAAE